MGRGERSGGIGGEGIKRSMPRGPKYFQVYCIIATLCYE